MNERIRALADEATTTEYGVDNGFDRVTFDKEKFAELIVRECVDVGIKDFYNHLPNIFPANAIKKHFGVKE